MKNQRPRKLHLSRVTVRVLRADELADAAGGALPIITAVGCWPRTNAWTGVAGVLCGA